MFGSLCLGSLWVTTMLFGGGKDLVFDLVTMGWTN